MIHPRRETDLPGCIDALWATHDASGYPAGWPRDPVRWLTSSGRDVQAGSTLMATAVDFIRASASRPVLTVADSGGAAIRRYERGGWRRVGEHRAEWREPDGRQPTVYDHALDPA